MIKRAHLPLIMLILLAAYLLTPQILQLNAPSSPIEVKAVPNDWAAHQAANKKAIAKHLEQHQEDYFAFANFAVSQTDGIPYLILKLLPKIAPEFWGSEENFLSVIGLYDDPRMGNYPMPSGIGISGLGRDKPLDSIDYASFTCGGCHIGRVRLENAEFQYLDGGINSEFNVILYRRKIVQSLNKLYAAETDTEKRQQRVINALLTALDTAQKSDPHYFYNNYQHAEYHFDAAYEKAQIELFRSNATQYITAFIDQQERAYDGWKLIVERNYKGIESRANLGYAGMEDAISFNSANAYQGLDAAWYTAPFASLALPNVAAVTDIMAVWDQQSRDPLGWDKDEKLLIDGGGQWNGHIPMLFYKNLAAQLTLGFNDVDLRVSAHAERLLLNLPAPAYPFSVNVELAKQGQALFAKNCATCHRDNNGRVYQQLGTHLGRAKIAGTITTLGAQSSFTADCGPDSEIQLSGKTVKPCAEYKGVSLEGKSNQSMTSPKQHDGYNALPLVGIWAQAPYLHNGSVPTLYHLLVPSERPDQFIKSRLDYDQEKVGFAWNVKQSGTEGEGYLYDTASSAIIGHQGHDRDIELDGQTFKLNWENNRAELKALLEYLKTL